MKAFEKFEIGFIVNELELVYVKVESAEDLKELSAGIAEYAASGKDDIRMLESGPVAYSGDDDVLSAEYFLADYILKL